MRIQIVTGYKEMFGEPRPSIDNLLENIPSSGIIAFFAAINNLLSLKGDSENSQLAILRGFSRSFSQEDRNYIAERLASIKAVQGSIALFSPHYVVAFICRELINYRDFKQVEISETEELDVLKSYMVFVDELEEENGREMDKIFAAAQEDKNKSLRNVLWPHLIKQFEFLVEPDMIFEIVKGLSFLKFLQESEYYNKYLCAFLKKVECPDPLTYIGRLFHLIQQNQNLSNGIDVIQFSLRFTMPPDEPVLKELILDLNKIKEKKAKLKDYIFLKERPLIKFREGEYVVSHWPYIYSNLYRGFVFAFYNNSGIATVEERLDSYLGAIGDRFMENVLFRSIMHCCFKKRGNVVLSPNKAQHINPDLYYREGNTIYLFEFKDALLRADLIHSNSYEEISNELRKKMAIKKTGAKTKNKGIYQLLEVIGHLTVQKQLLEFDKTIELNRLKQRNIIIYPIIVHSNSYFDMPGVNKYLSELFDEDLPQQGFKDIKPLTVINLQYFFQNLLSFKDGKLKLKNELDAYQHELVRLSKKAKRTDDVNDIGGTMPSFYEYTNSKERLSAVYKRGNFVKTIFDCLNIDLSSLSAYNEVDNRS